MKPDDGYIAYIVNPKAGAGSQRTISRQFRKYLLGKGFRVNAMLTASSMGSSLNVSPSFVQAT